MILPCVRSTGIPNASLLIIVLVDGNRCRSINFGCYSCGSNFVTVYGNDLGVEYALSKDCYNGTSRHAVSGPCTTVGFSACTVFAVTEFSVNTLEVSSLSPVEFFFGLSPRTFAGQLFNKHGYIEGSIQQVIIRSGSETIHFIKQISDTQYVTSAGILNLGEEYTIGPIDFTFDTTKTSSPVLPPVPQTGAVAGFAPFGGIHVYNQTQSVKFSYHYYNMALYASNEETGFLGVELTNPFFGVKDLQIYPPYNNNDDGTWIFQFAEKSSYYERDVYHALPAELNRSGNYRFYECHMNSLSLFSFSFSRFSFSFSFDEAGNYKENIPRAKTSDSMAFELF